MIDFKPLLFEAQQIINTHHKESSDFFSKCNFEIGFYQETDDAFGFCDGTFPNYIIGIHELLSEPTEDNLRFITITFVHELLHIIHADWQENQVRTEDHRLANAAGYFDTLLRRDVTVLPRLRSLKKAIERSNLNRGIGSTKTPQKPTESTIIPSKIVDVFRRLEETGYSDDPAKIPDEEGNLYIPKEWPKEYPKEIPQHTQSKSKNYNETECYYCKKPVSFIDSKSCKFCNMKFCMEHIQLEKHDCEKSKHTKYVRKTWLRKYGLNISTGKFKVVCDSCGYNSDFTFIEIAGRERENHIQESSCQGDKVFLEGEV